MSKDFEKEIKFLIIILTSRKYYLFKCFNFCIHLRMKVQPLKMFVFFEICVSMHAETL